MSGGHAREHDHFTPWDEEVPDSKDYGTSEWIGCDGVD